MILWISEQTVIISLYNIHGLFFLTEMKCVYCAVRTYLYIRFRLIIVFTGLM